MNGRVIFFPMVFQQSEEKLKDLADCQETLRFARISFLNAIKREDPYMQQIAHERLRSLIKERLAIVKVQSETAQE